MIKSIKTIFNYIYHYNSDHICNEKFKEDLVLKIINNTKHKNIRRVGASVFLMDLFSQKFEDQKLSNSEVQSLLYSKVDLVREHIRKQDIERIDRIIQDYNRPFDYHDDRKELFGTFMRNIIDSATNYCSNSYYDDRNLYTLYEFCDLSIMNYMLNHHNHNEDNFGLLIYSLCFNHEYIHFISDCVQQLELQNYIASNIIKDIKNNTFSNDNLKQMFDIGEKIKQMSLRENYFYDKGNYKFGLIEMFVCLDLDTLNGNDYDLMEIDVEKYGEVIIHEMNRIKLRGNNSIKQLNDYVCRRLYRIELYKQKYNIKDSNVKEKYLFN